MPRKTTAKGPGRIEGPGRIGRPPKADVKTERALVRFSKEDAAVYAAEVKRLTELTGQEWTVSGYLRLAGLAYAGKHLAAVSK